MSANLSAPQINAPPPTLSNEQLSSVLGIFGNQPAVPSSDLLIALRLLRDADPHAFNSLAKDELRFLKAGLAMVKADPFLRIKLGGDSLSAGVAMANILRSRAEAKHIERRIDPAVDALVQAEFLPTGMQSIAPLDPTANNGNNYPVLVGDTRLGQNALNNGQIPVGHGVEVGLRTVFRNNNRRSRVFN